jgi:hypothetical protein
MSVTESYRDVVERLYPRCPKGEPEEEVRRGEERLGRPFPRVLRGHYLFAGHRELLNQAQGRLLAPSCLRREGGAVIFYEENQGVNYWGVLEGDLGMDDPPVYV